jgi:hypothetical protein
VNLIFRAGPQDPSVAARFAVCPRQEGNNPQFSLLSSHKDAGEGYEVVGEKKYLVCSFVTLWLV